MAAVPGQTMMVNCPECGKALKVPAERAGKMAKCPGCMKTFTIPGGSGVVTSGAAAMPGRVKKGVEGETGKFVVSPTLIALGSIAVLVVGGILAMVYGPLKVKGDWEKMAPTAQAACEDVVARGLEKHLAASPFVNELKTHGLAGTKTFVFLMPFAMTMPARVGFAGMSTQGTFKGFYHPATGEVEADAEIGGTVLPSGVEVRKGSGSVHITGSKKGGEVEVEAD